MTFERPFTVIHETFYFIFAYLRMEQHFKTRG